MEGLDQQPDGAQGLHRGGEHRHRQAFGPLILLGSTKSSSTRSQYVSDNFGKAICEWSNPSRREPPAGRRARPATYTRLAGGRYDDLGHRIDPVVDLGKQIATAHDSLMNFDHIISRNRGVARAGAGLAR